jgi:hypothetical protein
VAIKIRTIQAHVDAPQVVEVPPRKKSLELAVRAELHNAGEETIVLHAPDEDREVFWHVFDENRQEIQRSMPMRKLRPAGGEVEEFRSLTLAAGLSVHRPTTLQLDAAQLEEGKTYTIRAEIWGQVAESEFVVIRTPPPPPKPKKKPPAKKKASGKKASAKKKTAAKAAKKKGSGKASKAKKS